MWVTVETLCLEVDTSLLRLLAHVCVWEWTLLRKYLVNKAEFGSSCSYDDLQCTIGLEFLFLKLEAGISVTFHNVYFIFSFPVHLHHELFSSPHFALTSGRLQFLLTWCLLLRWQGQGVHYCPGTACTLGPDGLGLRDVLSQWSCVFPLWHPNSILYFWLVFHEFLVPSMVVADLYCSCCRNLWPVLLQRQTWFIVGYCCCCFAFCLASVSLPWQWQGFLSLFQELKVCFLEKGWIRASYFSHKSDHFAPPSL